jgi:hypothetical protein
MRGTAAGRLRTLRFTFFAILGDGGRLAEHGEGLSRSTLCIGIDVTWWGGGSVPASRRETIVHGLLIGRPLRPLLPVDRVALLRWAWLRGDDPHSILRPIASWRGSTPDNRWIVRSRIGKKPSLLSGQFSHPMVMQ